MMIMNKDNNTADFEKTRKMLNKPLIIELMLRGGGIVLALTSIISSSICLNKLSLNTAATIWDYRPYSNSQIRPDTRAAAGSILFLSLVVFIYQFFAIFQQFVYLKLLFIKIPLGKSIWYLFPLIDIVVSIICIIGYLSSAIAMAVYSYQWMEPVVKTYQQSDSYPSNVYDGISAYINDYVLPVAFTCIFAFGSAARFIGNIVFIVLAKIKFKWPNYFVPES